MKKGKDINLKSIKFTGVSRKMMLSIYSLVALGLAIALGIWGSIILFSEPAAPITKEDNIRFNKEEIEKLENYVNLEKSINIETGLGKTEPFE